MKKGFTLIELLIVIAIIGVLVGLLAPAILRTSKTAKKQGRNTEMQVLQAGIMEYWHDNKAWPIARKPENEGAKLDQSTLTIYTYSGESTAYVWKRLLSKNNKLKKNYIDVAAHLTVRNKYQDKNPALNGDDGNIGKIIDIDGESTINGPIVYQSEFIECPECKAWSSENSDTCSNTSCSYEFTRADKKQRKRHGAKAYSIIIDVMSNTVRVVE